MATLESERFHQPLQAFPNRPFASLTRIELERRAPSENGRNRLVSDRSLYDKLGGERMVVDQHPFPVYVSETRTFTTEWPVQGVKPGPADC